MLQLFTLIQPLVSPNATDVSTATTQAKLTTSEPPKIIACHFQAVSAVIPMRETAMAQGRVQSIFVEKDWRR
jgi:hypothetical protein